MTGADVKIESIYKSYKEVKVLKEVNLTVEKGDFLTILGPSGAGKTTLLKMIAGFETPDSGKIMVNGENILDKPVHKRNIGMLFQNYALFPHMTVYDNIAYPLKIRKMPKEQIKNRVTEILQYVRLEEYAKRYPKQLSGGQQQRVALGRAIVFQPTVLLLDEPLGALDKQLRKQMQLEIKRMHEDMGLTTISVTHDQEEALTMSTKVCVMKDGMISQVDSPEDIYSRPVNTFVANFIGEANTVETKIVNTEGKIRWVFLYGQQIGITQKRFFLEKGMEATAIIRPEKIRLVDSDYEGICIGGTAIETIYAGDIQKIKMKTDMGAEVNLKVFTLAGRKVSTNDRIYISFSEKDVVLLPH